VALPGEERMEVMEKGGWNLPNGAAVVQTLTRQNRRLETRVLLRQENEWAGYTYAWNDAQSDAVLMSSEGETRQVAGQTWRFPGKQECAICHSRAANFLLGVSTVQLNRNDQIARWERAGLLKSNPAATDEAEWRRELEGQKLSGPALRDM